MVICKDDLRRLWAILAREADADYAEVPEAERVAMAKVMPAFIVGSAGMISTSSESDSILDNDVIDIHKTLAVDLSYQNPRTKKNIEMTILEGDRRDRDNIFSIRGEDPKWVDAIYSEFEMVFGAVRPQSKLFSQWRVLIIFALALAIGYSYAIIIKWLLAPYSAPIASWDAFFHVHIWLFWALQITIWTVTGWFPAWYLCLWVQGLWPSIEFDFGPEHLKARKNTRARLGTVSALLVLPFALEALGHFVFR